jgi:hypothetical protein
LAAASGVIGQHQAPKLTNRYQFSLSHVFDPTGVGKDSLVFGSALNTIDWFSVDVGELVTTCPNSLPLPHIVETFQPCDDYCPE